MQQTRLFLYEEYFKPYCKEYLGRSMGSICSIEYFSKLIRQDHRQFKFTAKQRFSQCKTCKTTNDRIKHVCYSIFFYKILGSCFVLFVVDAFGSICLSPNIN